MCYGVWYGVERAVVEGLRTDSLYIGNTGIRISQLFSIILVIVCGTLLFIGLIHYSRHPKPIEGVDFFREVPVYRYKRKVQEAKKLVSKFTALAEKAEASGDDRLAGKYRGKARAQEAVALKNQKLADEDDRKRAEKKLAKEAKKTNA